MTFIDIAKDKPQRHREDTERAQSRPPTSQPRRHKDTKASQSSSIIRRGPGRRAAGPPGESPTGKDARMRNGRAFHRVPAIPDRRCCRRHSWQTRSSRHPSLCASAPLRSLPAPDLPHLPHLWAGNLANRGSAPLCSSCLRGCDDPSLCVLCASVVGRVRC